MDPDIEKKGATDQVRSIDELSREDAEPLSHPAWAPGFMARFPWLGFGALFTVLLCAAGCIATLCLSNGRSERHWPSKIAPNVIIGGLNNLANIMFGIAIGNGVAIAWWRQTLKGSTIEELHRSWSFSSSFKELALSGRHFNWIALAALTTKLAIVDSILLQRATSTEIRQNAAVYVKDIYGFVNNTIPVTGMVVGRGAEPGVLTSNTLTDIAIWQQSGSLISNPFSNCDGLCNVYVPGAGFEIDCNGTTETIDLGTQVMEAAEAWSTYWTNNETGVEPNQTYAVDMFRVDFDVDFRSNTTTDGYTDGIDYSTLTMTMLYINTTDTSPNDTCAGALTKRTCTLRPAVINYPTTIETYSSGSHFSNGISLNFNSSSDIDSIGSTIYGNYNQSAKQQTGYQVLRYNPVHEDHSFNLDGAPSQLGGLLEIFTTYLSGNSSILWSGPAGFDITQEGLSASMLQTWPNSTNACGYAYTDPIDYLVQEINRLMFIYSLDPYSVDSANNFDTTVVLPPAQMYRDAIHYVTAFRYMWGAVASMLFCIACVLPSYYGYWQLGRTVTLGPFEIANAFRSPVLASEAANGEVKELIRVVGDRRVRYGEMTTETEAGRLAVADPQVVRRVHPGIGSARIEIEGRVGRVLGRWR